MGGHRTAHRAAEICNVSRPTRSAQVRKLEQKLGFDPFERPSHNLLPSTAI
ncbi:LysR family transcriptional regulator [Paracoccus yeei]|uniref:LysR family transcriptional regulator n=1 Tax=Paracoccus yeei TaxID=147645 RepID=A0A5P2QTN1_9RHOB|nr:LysR family transcriptional regulator [Paracoccus yeei]